MSKNREIYRSIRIIRALFPHAKQRFVSDRVPLVLRLQAAFTHARKVRVAEIALGWLTIRIPGTEQTLWPLVAHDAELDRDLVLITNVPIHTARDAETVYTEWRFRPQIEHTYRFDQEDGLDVEDVRVQTMERMRRCLCITLLTPGLSIWFCGFDVWEVDWAAFQIVMAPMFSWQAFVLS